MSRRKEIVRIYFESSVILITVSFILRDARTCLDKIFGAFYRKFSLTVVKSECIIVFVKTTP